MSKNIRNTNKSVINIDTNTALTTYSKSASLDVTYDPASALFPAPIPSRLQCEKIGSMIFIKINGFVAFPGSQSTIITNTGVIPIGYRPISNQICTALVVNGFVDDTTFLQIIEPYNTYVGCAILTTDGTLKFGPSRYPRFGPVTLDGSILTPFQGPKVCGLISQTLMFSYENPSFA